MKRGVVWIALTFLMVASMVLASCSTSSTTSTTAANTLISIMVRPQVPTYLPEGMTQQFTAIATYSDNSTKDITSQATWVSSSTSTATINSAGLATGVNTGTTNITASMSGITNSPITLTVIAPVASSTTSTTTSAVITTTATTTATGNWWDSLGTPQYGGQLTVSQTGDTQYWDPYLGGTAIGMAWGESLYGDNWTLDPSVFGYKIDFRPSDYVAGLLAKSWEFSDPTTFVVHLRQGVHFQNIAPVNGRELTSADIVYHYDRLYGLGGGFTTPSPNYAASPIRQNVTSVTAPDKYTVVFKWNVSSPEFILETIEALGSNNQMEAVEAVNLWGNLNDWHHAIGTGPFILNDYVSASSVTMVKNHNYWGYDERYPQNQLPYVDSVKVFIIPIQATALAAVRTGKIDYIDGVNLSNAQGMTQTNPEILQQTMPLSASRSVDITEGIAPYNDIRVRKALQLAMDLPTLAKTYYGGTCPPYPSGLTSMYETGWGLPYTQWPADLQAEYAYNPTAAKQLLSDAGFANGFNTDVVAQAGGDMDLLQIVVAYLASINVKVEIRLMDGPSYNNFVRTGHKQDALAYGSNGSLGFSYDPIRQILHFQTGYSANYTNISDPVIDAMYPAAIASPSVDAFKKILINANLEIAKRHVAISLLTPNNFVLTQPWLRGFNGQADALNGGVGPLMFGFYTSRFWIDLDVKKSFGH